ncbi:hypothetical protein BIFGAL_03620 [Bifidobacterium gallicum DSM 20093 = LMG 11596]|uniref:Uncharacterized protein n=1 Tax=Bifidobacterium gallicum DSM 20093 = LMG 11596 TaxID=561180 RepID=D1NUU3_9BIFI|nr:hypothetical protein BIFGAL_03620 [Bifidobacterium gallicum DSM 20093 = LMG 11596]
MHMVSQFVVQVTGVVEHRQPPCKAVRHATNARARDYRVAYTNPI